MAPYGVAHREEIASRRPEYLDTVGVTGSNPVSRMEYQSVSKFAYTYVLRCSDGKLYVVPTTDL